MPAQVAKLRKVIAYAAAGGAPVDLLRDVARDAVGWLANEDPRAAETLERGRQIETLLANGVEPEAITERYGWSRDQYFRGLRRWRDTRNSYAREFPQLQENSP